MKKSPVLIIDDETDFRSILREHLEEGPYEIFESASGEEALSLLREKEVYAVLLDEKMPGIGGLELLKILKEEDPLLEVIIITGHGEIESAVQAMKSGAVDYLTKPVRFAELDVTLQKALELRALRKQTETLREGVRKSADFPFIIGTSKKISKVLDLVKQVAPTDSTALITGESGTGKELLARAIHENSSRAGGPFIVLDCAAINENLIENELFGHEKGAYTGADLPQPGLVEIADGGTLFIDEMAEMGLSCQTRFLRFIETGEFRRLGSQKSRRADLRIVAATNKSVPEEVKAKRFREDLYYRINVFHIEPPPLRERREDIPLLAKHFIETSKVRPIRRPELSPEALRMLVDHPWPGNIRELANVMERAMISCNGSTIRPEHLFLKGPSIPFPKGIVGAALTPLATVEEAHIRQVLKATEGNKRRAAQILGISLRNLYRKIKAS